MSSRFHSWIPKGHLKAGPAAFVARPLRRIRDGLRPLPPTPIKNKLATQLSSTLRDPAGLLVRSPGKPYHTTFLTGAGIPRRFSSVPPENLVTQLSSPWLHPAGLLARSDLNTPGPRRRVFSRIPRFAPRPGNQARTQAGNEARLSPLRDSAPSLYIIFCMISCGSAPCPEDGSSRESLTLH